MRTLANIPTTALLFFACLLKAYSPTNCTGWPQGTHAQGESKPLLLLFREYLLTTRVDTIFSYARTKSRHISGQSSSVTQADFTPAKSQYLPTLEVSVQQNMAAGIFHVADSTEANKKIPFLVTFHAILADNGPFLRNIHEVTTQSSVGLPLGWNRR